MFKKECKDTAKSLSTALILSMTIIIVSFYIIRVATPYKITFSEILFTITQFVLLLIAIYLGTGLFGEEKKQGNFEYLFSLRYSRAQLLINKLIPRVLALGILLLIYFILMLIAAESLLKPLLFIPLIFAIFLFFASLSLLHENNTLNTIYNLIGFAITLGAITLIEYVIPFRLNQHIFFFLSITLFIIFVMSFKTIDLSNLYFEFMKKNLIKLTIVFGSIILLITGINQLDISKDTTGFSERDLLPARFEAGNGFYRFLTIFEPADVDIESTKTINKYRSLFDPQFNKKTNNHKWNHQTFKKMSSLYSNIWNHHIKSKQPNWLKWQNGLLNQSWSRIILSEKVSIRKLVNKLDVLLNRYQKMVDSPLFLDFYTPKREKYIWSHSMWLGKISKVYIPKLMLDCLEGNWNRGIAALIKHLNFTKEVIKGSRSTFTNGMAKSSMQLTLRAISDLMNSPECPREIYKLVYDSMPDLPYEYYGSKNAIIANYLSFVDYMQNGVKEKINNALSYFLYRLFLQENRTMGYISEWTKNSIELDRKQPFISPNMGEKLREKYNNLNGFLWWLHNPSGKILIKEHWYPKVYSSYWSYTVKTLYDMTKISAQLRMNDKSKQVVVTLRSLKSYKTLMDPFSGKPYKYNVKKRMIYSVGRDLVDNNGVQKVQWDKDIVLPLSVRKK